MNLDKISDERLFANNAKEDIMNWCSKLRYFHYMRARGGHNCEGDSFCVYFRYDTREDLISKLSLIGVNIKKLQEDEIAFDPFESYSIDDLDKLRITMSEFRDLIQPQNVEIYGKKAHVWVIKDRFEISISGTKDGQIYKVTDDDFDVCLLLEEKFDQLKWKSILDYDIESQIHCVSSRRYPELYSKRMD